ncbi:MAG: hypothetical protein LZ159_05870, partial [Thaumarchaeota archaeon]|nr:hypothetical protein [Candidatus Terraquivivens yellowstonensis]
MRSLRHAYTSLWKIPLIEGAYCYAVRESRIFGDKNSPKRGKVKDVYDLGTELLIYHTDRVSSFDVV